jgi:hypothetical protein
MGRQPFPTGLPEPVAMPLAEQFRALEESSYLLLGKHEITWLTAKVEAGGTVDYFLSLGCGVQGIPHLMLDSVAVLKALGVSFVAGGGRQFCCGNPLRGGERRLDAADRLTAASVERMLGWGARAVLHWCTACQLTFGAWGSGADEVLSADDVLPLAPGREKGPHFANLHIHDFLASLLEKMGDRVPWRKEIPMRVLVEGHPELTQIHGDARSAGARMLSFVPGVEVVGYVDPPEYFRRPGGNCQRALTEMTAADVRRTRRELAEQARARGADTVSCQHHNCHRTWSRFSSDALAVKQCVSIVAEALGVSHVDRYQIAAKMGDADAVVAHTRSIWSTWEIEESRATAIARRLFEPKYAERPACACGGDPQKCGEALIPLR